MPLDQIALGTEARIVEIGGAEGFRRRLMEMGFLPGTAVKLVRKNAVGGVVEVEVRRSRVSLRLAEARQLRVTDSRAG